MGYQRRCIAENSARYERQRRRATTEHPEKPRRRIIGYNVYELPDGHPDKYPPWPKLVRPDPADWERQLSRVRDFRERHRDDAPVYLERLKEVALQEGTFSASSWRRCGRHPRADHEDPGRVGGRYRKMV